MKVNVLFFGVLADKIGINSLLVEDVKNSDELIESISERIPAIRNHKFAVAVNQKVILNNTYFNDGDEIALLPPYAGG